MSDSTGYDRRAFLGAAALTVASAKLGLTGCANEMSNRKTAAQDATPRSAFNDLRALEGATDWIDSPPLTAASLQGRVVLLDFCTYTCINWLRQLPFVRAWSSRYADQGLVVIGAHAPEFEFERDLGNVRQAVKELQAGFPFAIDNDFAIWRAFGNQYWPALYFIDAHGRLRGHHFGEGEYAKSERMIQKLLREAGSGVGDSDVLEVTGLGVEAPADWKSLRTPETYLGWGRAQNFSSPGGVAADAAHVYDVPPRLGLNRWALAGDWTIRRHAAAANRPGARIVFRFHARDVHLVMGPLSRDVSPRFRVRVDGGPPGPSHGLDIDAHGSGVVAEQRLFQLVRQRQRVVERQLEIQFLDPGVEAYAFTFG